MLPILALVIAGTAGAVSAATAVHPHDDIVAMVEGAALSAAESEGLEDIEVRVHPLDPRLRPALCDRPLDIIRPHAGRALGPVSYGVRCAGSVPWTLYLRAEVSAALSLPVLRSPLPRGALIAEDDLEMTTRRITARAVDLIVDPAQAVGMELQRPLAAGSPLRHGQVARPRLIERGQTVTLIAGARGLEVRMKGTAMGNGAEGDRILVSNASSGRRVEGVVRADGSVGIP
jgi:flagella basal body P-ring formation protein FlgA